MWEALNRSDRRDDDTEVPVSSHEDLDKFVDAIEMPTSFGGGAGRGRGFGAGRGRGAGRDGPGGRGLKRGK